jgi:hypothetical protein
MRETKTNPGYVKTRKWGDIERALRDGVGEMVVTISGLSTRRRTILAMHVMGDRVLFFDPQLNPELSYAADLGVAGTPVAGIPTYRYEGRGLHSLERGYLRTIFQDGKAFALLPLSHKLKLAV